MYVADSKRMLDAYYAVCTTYYPLGCEMDISMVGYAEEQSLITCPYPAPENLLSPAAVHQEV